MQQRLAHAIHIRVVRGTGRAFGPLSHRPRPSQLRDRNPCRPPDSQQLRHLRCPLAGDDPGQGRLRNAGRVRECAGELARAAHEAHIGFAIGAKRIAPLWRLLAGIDEDDWHDAIDMDNAQVAVAEYCPDWWPADTRLLIRRRNSVLTA
jgi:hypothetical protein